MSEYDPKDPEKDDEAPHARVHVSNWSPWVWILPALVILVLGFLVLRYGFGFGGNITVRFAEARGLERFSPVRYKGAKVGTVQEIAIDEEKDEVVVSISMDSYMRHALVEGTRFWIVEPGLEGGGLGSLLAGTYVAMAPGNGDRTSEFRGQEYAPILPAPEAGKTFVLQTHMLGGMSAGSPVTFEGVRVGRVLGAEHNRARDMILVHVFVVERYADLVRETTRFWRSGGLDLKLSGGGLSMGDSSLASLLSGGVAFYTPEILSGAPAKEGTRFDLHGTRSAAIASSEGPHLTYATYFTGPVGGLTPGTAVRMKGVEVGHVREVRLRYVPESASLETPVTIAIDPRKLEIFIDPATTREELRARMNDALDALIRKGMRATLATSLILPGASAVSLEIVDGAGSARLAVNHEPPLIPAAETGSGLEGALASANRIARTIESLPLREIAGDLRSASRRVNALVSDPALESSLQRLDRSLAEIERITTVTGRNIDPIVTSLRNAAVSAESAAARAQELMGSSVQQNYDLGELVKELTRAAEAVRALANYLTENPDALIKGRPE